MFQSNMELGRMKKIKPQQASKKWWCGSIVLVVTLLVGAGCSSTRVRQAQEQAPEISGWLEHAELSESSGLARSQCVPDRYWTHNDSGGKPVLYALDAQGRDQGQLQLEGASAKDWEDVTSATLNGRNLLFAGDIGDNKRCRKVHWIYGVEEPDELISWSGDGGGQSIPVFRAISFRYPDGKHNCEALAVDPESGELLLISKVLIGSCGVYSMAQEDWMNGPYPITARRIGTLNLTKVTGLDISADGQRVVVLTYGDAYEFRRAAGMSWAEVFQTQPRRIKLPSRRQGEAICYNSDETVLLLTSEKQPAPLWRVPLVEDER